MVLQELGEIEELNAHKATKPNAYHVDANFNLSMLLNLKGDLKKALIYINDTMKQKNLLKRLIKNLFGMY